MLSTTMATNTVNLPACTRSCLRFTLSESTTRCHSVEMAKSTLSSHVSVHYNLPHCPCKAVPVSHAFLPSRFALLFLSIHVFASLSTHRFHIASLIDRHTFQQPTFTAWITVPRQHLFILNFSGASRKQKKSGERIRLQSSHQIFQRKLADSLYNGHPLCRRSLYRESLHG